MTDEQKKIIEKYQNEKMEHIVGFLPSDVLPVHFVKTKEKCVAFTFDCCYGYSRKKAFKKLFFLKTHGHNYTFFVTGIFVKNCKSIMKWLKCFGFEIMNHSVSHKNFLTMEKEEQEFEITNNANEIEKFTGVYPNMFRYPFGAYGVTSNRILQSLGIKSINWSIDTIDWQPDRTSEEIYNSIIDHIKPGSIILCHLRGVGFDGVKKAMIELKKQGYKFLSVSELLALDVKNNE